ncbi:hypothetical protein NEAUS06_2478 [Nematocida ausubeli]|nr:hypothetical protein NEAUS06_2267 [Nematocida ausubeli]KAI5138270.1 hypothetical protein NEAUS06_2478 [Nematocida ausubeli]
MTADGLVLHKDWVSLCNRLLKNPKTHLKEISRMLGRSQKFMAAISGSGESPAYASYADTLRETVERILSVLISNCTDADSHPGIFYIISSYKNAFVCDFTPIIQIFLVESSSFYILRIIERICSHPEIIEKLEETEVQILMKLGAYTTDPEYSTGEFAVRGIFSLYKRKKGRHLFLSVLSKSFQIRYLDLFVSKIFPEIIASEDSRFVISMIEILSKIKEIPILLISQNAKRETLLAFPSVLQERIWNRLESEKLPQEYIAGISLAAKVPELFNINRLIRLLVNHKDENILYSQGDALIHCLNTLNISNYHITEEDNRIIAEEPEEPEDNSNKRIISIDKHLLTEFLKRLLFHSDGTRIEYCRILFTVKIPSQKESILTLLRNKNIRVKWNALRTLTVYTLTDPEITKIITLLTTSQNEKIKMWSLKILEVNKRKINPNLFQMKESQYKSEMEEILKRINN